MYHEVESTLLVAEELPLLENNAFYTLVFFTFSDTNFALFENLNR